MRKIIPIVFIVILVSTVLILFKKPRDKVFTRFERAVKNVGLKHSGLSNTDEFTTIAGQTTAGQTTAGQTTAGQTTAGQTTAGQTTAGQTTAGQTTAGQTTAGQTTAGPTTAGQTTAGQTNAGQTTAGQTTAGQTTAGQTTAGQTTAGQTTAGQTNAGPLLSDVTNIDLKKMISELNSTNSIKYILNNHHDVINVFFNFYNNDSIRIINKYIDNFKTKYKNDINSLNIDDIENIASELSKLYYILVFIGLGSNNAEDRHLSILFYLIYISLITNDHMIIKENNSYYLKNKNSDNCSKSTKWFDFFSDDGKCKYVSIDILISEYKNIESDIYNLVNTKDSIDENITYVFKNFDSISKKINI
jgi:hypothetical protein